LAQQTRSWCAELKPRKERVSCCPEVGTVALAPQRFAWLVNKIRVNLVKANEKIFGFVVLLFFVLSSEDNAFAQLTPDSTLGNENSIVTPGAIINNQSAERIEGGALRDTNLFHSFLEFNLDDGQQVYFANPPGVENILTRVTGANSSTILGTLGVEGTANLFLINPNGILFGPNARLDVSGSFFASTASSVVFADGTQFSTTSPQNLPLLTVSVPLGLQFGATPGSLQIQGSNLAVLPGKTLGLVGGNVLLQGGNVTAPSGRVELGSVAGTSLVDLNPTPNGWELGYSTVPNFQDIELSQGATVDVSGIRGGDIQVQARTFQLREESRLTALTLGRQRGGTVTVNASESVELIGTGTYIEDIVKFATGTVDPTNLRNGLFTASFDSGSAGDLVINTPSFVARNGAFVATSTFGTGEGGHLTLNASESVDLSASSLLTGTGAGVGGDAGDLTINTGRLLAQDNATVTTASFGTGRAGNLTVNALESIELVGSDPVQFSPTTRFFTGLFSNALAAGDAGNVEVTTGELLVRDGAAIAASTVGSSRGGDITVIASESVTLSGSSPNGSALSALAATAEAGSTGQGGNLTVQTGELILENEGRLSVRSRGTGDAGNLKVIADSISLDEQASIAAATTIAGEGGNVNLKTQSLLLRRNSIVSAEAGGSGNGGNITIDTDVLAVLENSRITANALQGAGGRIEINTQGLFVDPTSRITASSTLGINGVVDIDTSVRDVEGSLEPLEEEFVSSDQVLADSCLARRSFQPGSFTVTGTGGLPSTPYGAISDRYTVTNVEPISGNSATRRDRIQQAEFEQQRRVLPLQEAQGIFVTDDGRIILGTSSQVATLAKVEDLVCLFPDSASQSRE
jgi:filamentous hemagglutinin family protein